MASVQLSQMAALIVVYVKLSQMAAQKYNFHHVIMLKAKI